MRTSSHRARGRRRRAGATGGRPAASGTTKRGPPFARLPRGARRSRAIASVVRARGDAPARAVHGESRDRGGRARAPPRTRGAARCACGALPRHRSRSCAHGWSTWPRTSRGATLTRVRGPRREVLVAGGSAQRATRRPSSSMASAPAPAPWANLVTAAAHVEGELHGGAAHEPTNGHQPMTRAGELGSRPVRSRKDWRGVSSMAPPSLSRSSSLPLPPPALPLSLPRAAPAFGTRTCGRTWRRSDGEAQQVAIAGRDSTNATPLARLCAICSTPPAAR